LSGLLNSSANVLIVLVDLGVEALEKIVLWSFNQGLGILSHGQHSALLTCANVWVEE
jgi:hypothetical protein